MLSPRTLAKFFLTSAAAGCRTSDGSAVKDIYAEDAGDPDTGNPRRHPATAEEKRFTVSLAGKCTGTMLSKNLMLTAHHCLIAVRSVPFTSGAALARGEKDDLRAEALVEADATLDYAIVRVRWKGEPDAEQRYVERIVTRREDVVISRAPNEGDELFTVGFPMDKKDTWGATYSEGRLKAFSPGQQRAYYNVGTLNGNSGGGAWRKHDLVFVAMTNGGPNRADEPGAFGGSVDDFHHWNNGVALWVLHGTSAIVRRLFPDGKLDREEEARLMATSDGPSLPWPTPPRREQFLVFPEPRPAEASAWVAPPRPEHHDDRPSTLCEMVAIDVRFDIENDTVEFITLDERVRDPYCLHSGAFPRSYKPSALERSPCGLVTHTAKRIGPRNGTLTITDATTATCEPKQAAGVILIEVDETGGRTQYFGYRSAPEPSR